MINGDQANSAFLPSNFSCVSMATSYAGSFFTLFAIRIVTAKEATDPTTTASSAPTKYETTISGTKKDNPETKTTGTMPLKAEPFPFVLFPKI